MKRISETPDTIRAIDEMARKYVARMFLPPSVLPSKRDGWMG